MGFRDGLLSRRDALLADPRFRQWAARFPLTRFLARRASRRLFDLCAGFVYTQILLACQRLRLFDILAEGPLRSTDLAGRVNVPEPRLERLLGAAEALALLERRSGGRWGLGPLGAPLVGNEPVGAMIEHNALLYDDLADPLALLRDEVGDRRLARFWGYARSPMPADVGMAAVGPYSTLMARSVALVADEFVRHYPLERHRAVLDVGGGEGAFLDAIGRRAPRLRLMLFDLPAVAARARARLSAAGHDGRVTVMGGDFHRDALPSGADLLTLVRVLHDHDDDAVGRLLRRCHAALDPGGRIVVAEPFSGVAGAPTTGPVYFAFYLLAMGSGRTRSPGEYARLLSAAGFGRLEVLPSGTPVQSGFLTGVKL